jgi:hypothetical protein
LRRSADDAVAGRHGSIGLYADLRCDLAAGFFVAASFAGFLPVIGISISFWPTDAFLDFLVGFFSALVAGAAPPTPRRSASIRSTTHRADLAAVDEFVDLDSSRRFERNVLEFASALG